MGKNVEWRGEKKNGLIRKYNPHLQDKGAFCTWMSWNVDWRVEKHRLGCFVLENVPLSL